MHTLTPANDFSDLMNTSSLYTAIFIKAQRAVFPLLLNNLILFR